MTLYSIKKSIKLTVKDILYYLGYNRNKEVLVYLGLNRGFGINGIFRNYKVCYGFEADPELFKILDKKYKKYKNVHIINAAVAKEDGFIEFNISNNNGASSSIGEFKAEWNNNNTIKMVKKITVPSINLCNFLTKRNVKIIDDYVSDIQGYDLEVLKTLQPFIANKKIISITSEVAKDDKKNIYKDLPDNNLSAFNMLLEQNYNLVATGEGILVEGQFNEVPEDWWEMDCMWRVKP